MLVLSSLGADGVVLRCSSSLLLLSVAFTAAVSSAVMARWVELSAAQVANRPAARWKRVDLTSCTLVARIRVNGPALAAPGFQHAGSSPHPPAEDVATTLPAAIEAVAAMGACWAESRAHAKA